MWENVWFRKQNVEVGKTWHANKLGQMKYCGIWEKSLAAKAHKGKISVI